MDADRTYHAVLTVFATYGFRKTSMAELAEAANVSRQTLYNRFQTKQAVLDWAVEGRSAELEGAAIAALDGPGDLKARILAFFSAWIGPMVPFLRNAPHGAEIFEMAKGVAKRGGADPHADCRDALAQFIAREVETDAADDLTHLLILVSKGLLMTAPGEDEYAAEMARALDTTLRHVT